MTIDVAKALASIVFGFAALASLVGLLAFGKLPAEPFADCFKWLAIAVLLGIPAGGAIKAAATTIREGIVATATKKEAATP
jgi:hypothetical protein